MKKLHKNILFAAAVLVMPSALADIPESSVPAAAVSYSCLIGGFSLIFKFLLQPACVRYQFYISEHLELLSYNTSYIVPIKQCHIYWFYCVLTLYTIYRKSRLSILFDRQGDPSFVYNFI